jgi:hypothetical protein
MRFPNSGDARHHHVDQLLVPRDNDRIGYYEADFQASRCRATICRDMSRDMAARCAWWDTNHLCPPLNARRNQAKLRKLARRDR